MGCNEIHAAGEHAVAPGTGHVSVAFGTDLRRSPYMATWPYGHMAIWGRSPQKFGHMATLPDSKTKAMTVFRFMTEDFEDGSVQIMFKPTTAEGELILDEYLKYMAIKIAFEDRNSESFNPPSQDVDDLWHRHILATHKYTRFCRLYGEIANLHDFLRQKPTHEAVFGDGVSMPSMLPLNLMRESCAVPTNTVFPLGDPFYVHHSPITDAETLRFMAKHYKCVYNWVFARSGAAIPQGVLPQFDVDHLSDSLAMIAANKVPPQPKILKRPSAMKRPASTARILKRPAAMNGLVQEQSRSRSVTRRPSTPPPPPISPLPLTNNSELPLTNAGPNIPGTCTNCG